jgi:hypothetical protein
MPPLNGQSNDVNTPAVTGDNTASGPGVFGDSGSGPGVSGHSITAAAVAGESDRGSGVSALGHGTAPALESVNDNATADAGPGLRARSAAAGVIGESTTWMGVFGLTQSSTGGNGVMGQAVGTGAGVFGESTDGIGVFGQTSSLTTSAAGVRGVATNTDGVGPAVIGENQGSGPGVLGTAIHDAGVTGFHGDPRLQETTVANEGAKAGVFGASDVGAGVLGYARSPDSAGVVAFGGILASAINHRLAGEFFGDVEVHGDIFLPGADCAEQFDLDDDEEVEAGDVVVISLAGGLRRSTVSYDKAVAGVVSGAGTFRPAIVLDGRGNASRRRPIALVGKVFCKVDARYGAVNIGDMLTSSDTPGHAMLAADPAHAFGSVLGKALGRLSEGTGLVPVLVCLQ